MSLNALLLMKCAFRVNEVNDFKGSGILILELECLWTCHFIQGGNRVPFPA